MSEAPGLTPEQRTALEAELTDLQRKADKRRNEGGYAANVAAIEARIAVIEAELAG
jgi:hypothetical protein